MTVINKLELIHFGKFTNAEIELFDGKNIFFHQNEWGKSTVCDFLIYMLYGFKKTAKKSILLQDNFLKKYLPWGDDSYIQGALELTKDGKRFRIERKTLASGRMSLSVFDMSANAIDIVDVGEHFFGVDCETFMRTFLVRQTDIAFDGTNDIETALKNLVTTGDEDTSFEDALKVITDQKNKYQHGDRRSGRVFDIPKQITEKQLEVSSLCQRADTLANDLSELGELNGQLKQCEDLEKKLSANKKVCEANDAKAIFERATEILNEIASYKQKLTANSVTISDDSAKYIADTFNKAEVLKTTEQNAAERFESAERELADVSGALAGIEYVEQNEEQIKEHLAKKPSVNIPVIVIGIGICVMAVASPFLAILGAVLILLGVVVKTKPKPILNKTNEQLQSDLDRYYKVKQKIAEARVKYNSAKDELALAKSRLNDILPSIENIKSTYKIESVEMLSNVVAQGKSLGVVEAHINSLNKRLTEVLGQNQIGYYAELAKDADNSGMGTKELDELIMQNSQKKTDCAVKLSALESKRIEKEQLLQAADKLSGEILALKSELETAQYNNRVLEIARDTLIEAYDKINNTYSPIICKKISPYVSILTGGKYSDVLIDRQFNIRVKYKGEYKELGYFSRGTADSIYFAVRVAMAEILEGDGTLPLILDDPFWSLDNERKQNANALLDTLCKTRQVLVFCAD